MSEGDITEREARVWGCSGSRIVERREKISDGVGEVRGG